MKKYAITWVICAFAWSLSAGELPAQGDVRAFSDYLDAKTRTTLEENMIPGLAVAVLTHGQVAFSKGYGPQNSGKPGGINPETVFNIGSISKTVAAWGVMRLVEEGRLNLDEPVQTYLKSWQLPETEFDNKGVTIRRLLSHTAGLSVRGYPGFQPNEKRPSVIESLLGEASGSGATAPVKTIMEPGTQWKYAGGGYTLLQLMIGDVTGMPFETYMEQKVLKPLGMNSSSYGLPARLESSLATPYGDFGRQIELRRFTAQAAASLKVSLNDFIRFARASIPKAQGGTGGGGVISEDTLKSMWVRPPNSPRYGLGYGVTDTTGGIRVGHGGDNGGWHAQFGVVPHTGDGIIILTNSDAGTHIRRSLSCAWRNWQDGTEGDCFKPSLRLSLTRVFTTKGIDAFINDCKAAKQNEVFAGQFNEGLLNGFGYSLLQGGDLVGAVKIFELNVDMYPEASNPHDSLGEGYMNQKRYGLAIKHYRKSFELDPKNNNATKMIAEIERLQASH